MLISNLDKVLIVAQFTKSDSQIWKDYVTYSLKNIPKKLRSRRIKNKEAKYKMGTGNKQKT